MHPKGLYANLGSESFAVLNLWTGIACLVPDPKCKEVRVFEGDDKGAYVNVVAWANSAQEFADRVKQAVRGIDCILLELERIQLLDRRMEEPSCAEELITMRTTAQQQPGDAVFGTFHTWTRSNVN